VAAAGQQVMVQHLALWRIWRRRQRLWGASAGGTGNTPCTSPAQGTNGGAGSDTNPYQGGGGGGGATKLAELLVQLQIVVQGGNGTASSITGTSVTYAGGGAADLLMKPTLVLQVI
jgi:hypothetical protein